MKMKTLLLATALIAMATGGAFAQAGGAMSGQSGATTSGTGPTPAQKTQQKDASPAKTDSGAKQEK
jgi:hypothetical protein